MVPVGTCVGIHRTGRDSLYLHVSVLTGWECFRFLAEDYSVPGTVVGFAPADVMRGVADLLRQVQNGTAEITNLYSRVVSPHGNQVAAKIVEKFFGS